MCGLTPMLIAASAAVGAVGQIQEGRAAAQAGEANAVVQERNSVAAEANAKAAERNALRSQAQAADAIKRGETEEYRKREEGRLTEGSQRAFYSAGNIDIGSGSPLDAIVATATGIELDALTIRRSARREADDFEMQAYNQRMDAYNQRVQGNNQKSGAAISRAEGRNAKKAGVLGAAGTVLGGGAKIYKYRASTT